MLLFIKTRIAQIGIIIENFDVTNTVNSLIHTYRQYIVGRMGLPKVRHNIAVICLVLDAPDDIISALAGKIGQLNGVFCKTIYSRTIEDKVE